MYHFLQGSHGRRAPRIDAEPEPSGPSWLVGQKLPGPFPDPLVYLLGPGGREPPGALYDRLALPVMHRELASALDEAGVDNVDYYPALLREPDSGREWGEHLAFNVLGLLSCAVRRGDSGAPCPPGEDPDALVVDPGRTMGLRLFRVLEVPGALVVDDVVREAVERRGIRGVAFADSRG